MSRRTPMAATQPLKKVVALSGERRELERTLASPTFQSAPRLSRFLRYIGELALAGDAEGLKEYSIGVEVFDRGEGFDPRIDTIVRVQARRLRRRLEEYYEKEGRNTALRIEIPKGGYVPRFVPAPPAPPPLAVSFDGLPAPRTSLIGRGRELEELTSLLLRDDVRLVTVTGAGGSGKTRLAVEAAARIGARFPGGITYLELAALTSREAVAVQIAQSYGLRRTDGKPLEEALCERLRATISAPALLALDNLEHLPDAAPLISKLLDSCASLTVLATSRSLLRLYGEHEFPAPPLEAPPPGASPADELLDSPAVQLFVDRAKATRPGFEVDPETARTVAEICFRLDGLPLAIELAAGRSKTYSLEALLEKIGNPLELLTAGPRDVPDRQRPLRDTIRWSHELLDEPEKKLFRRLAAFVGGCALEGAEAVADAYQDLGADVAEGAASLVDKNLLQTVERPGEPARFVMLETIREFGLEALAASGEAETVRRAHAAYCLVVAEEGECRRSEEERAEWFALCDREYGNLSAALDWLPAAGGVAWAARMAKALFPYWERQERLAEGRRRLQAVAGLPGVPERMKALAAGFAGALIGMQGDIDGAMEQHQRSLKIFRKLNLLKDIARETNSLSVGYRFTGRLEQARESAEECLAVCRQVGDPNQIAAALSNLAAVAGDQGRFDEADAMLREAQSIFREIGNWIGLAWSLNHLGDQARARGDHPGAWERYGEALELFLELHDRWGEGRTLGDMAALASELGDQSGAWRYLQQSLDVFAELPHHRGVAKALDSLAMIEAERSNGEAAYLLAGAAATMREMLGADPSPWRVEDRTQLEDALRQASRPLGSAAAQAAWDRGRTMTLDEAVGYAKALQAPRPS